MKQVSQTSQHSASATRPSTAGTESESSEGSEAGSFIIYIDHCALTRDCIARELALLLPEFRVMAFSNPGESRIEPSQIKRVGCVIYHTHSLLIEDAPVLRDLYLLRRVVNAARIVVLSDLDATKNVVGAMRRGVAGYVPTSFSLKIAAEAIRLVLAGGTFIPASALPITLQSEPAPASGLINGANGASPIRFTLRQNQVLRHLWEGEPNKTIAHALRMKEGTVKVHVKNIMKKLHARNRTQVVLMTQRMFGETEDLVVEEASNLARRRLAASTLPLRQAGSL